MQDIAQIRSKMPASCPDQSIYARYACGEFGLAFADLDGGTGQIFSVASKTRHLHFAAGRCSWYPQNNATASTLASDKYFTNVILERAGVATLGGDYFFLHERHRAHRPSGTRSRTRCYILPGLAGTGFVKPLMGSRGDFAQAIHDEAVLKDYISRCLALLRCDRDAAVGLRARNTAFSCSTTRCCMPRANIHLCGSVMARARSANPDRAQCQPASARTFTGCPGTPSTTKRSIAYLPKGERWDIPGRMNLSAGGKMVLEASAFGGDVRRGEGKPPARSGFESPPSTSSQTLRRPGCDGGDRSQFQPIDPAIGGFAPRPT